MKVERLKGEVRACGVSFEALLATTSKGELITVGSMVMVNIDLMNQIYVVHRMSGFATGT